MFQLHDLLTAEHNLQVLLENALKQTWSEDVKALCNTLKEQTQKHQTIYYNLLKDLKNAVSQENSTTDQTTTTSQVAPLKNTTLPAANMSTTSTTINGITQQLTIIQAIGAALSAELPDIQVRELINKHTASHHHAQYILIKNHNI